MTTLATKESLSCLYDEYAALLTESQRTTFEDYYFLDLSLQEIAENRSVSRNAVFDSLKKTGRKLVDYEEKLHLAARRAALDKALAQAPESELVRTLKKIMEE